MKELKEQIRKLDIPELRNLSGFTRGLLSRKQVFNNLSKKEKSQRMSCVRRGGTWDDKKKVCRDKLGVAFNSNIKTK